MRAAPFRPANRPRRTGSSGPLRAAIPMRWSNSRNWRSRVTCRHTAGRPFSPGCKRNPSDRPSTRHGYGPSAPWQPARRRAGCCWPRSSPRARLNGRTTRRRGRFWITRQQPATHQPPSSWPSSTPSSVRPTRQPSPDCCASARTRGSRQRPTCMESRPKPAPAAYGMPSLPPCITAMRRSEGSFGHRHGLGMP